MKNYLKLILKSKIANAKSEYYKAMADAINPNPTPKLKPEAVKPKPLNQKPSSLNQKPLSQKPEAVKPEAVKPEAVKPEAVKPEAVKPKPEAVKPKPEAVKPKPEAVKPEPEVNLEILNAEVDIYKKANSAKEALALLDKHDLKLAGTLGRSLSALGDDQRDKALEIFVKANDPEIKNTLVKEAGDALRQAVRTSGDRDRIQALLLEHTGVAAIGMLPKVSQGKIETLLLALIEL